MADALTTADRCDRCAAQAQHHIAIAETGGLMFCGHHYDEHKDRLPQSPAAAASGHAGE